MLASVRLFVCARACMRVFVCERETDVLIVSPQILRNPNGKERRRSETRWTRGETEAALFCSSDRDARRREPER